MNTHWHIDVDILSDWMNELLLEQEKDYCEAQVNLTELLTEFAEDPNPVAKPAQKMT